MMTALVLLLFAAVLLFGVALWDSFHDPKVKGDGAPTPEEAKIVNDRINEAERSAKEAVSEAMNEARRMTAGDIVARANELREKGRK